MTKGINHLNILSKNVVDFLSTEATKSINFSSRYALIHPEVMETGAGLLGKVLSSLSHRKSLSQNDTFLDFNFYDLQGFSGLWHHH